MTRGDLEYSRLADALRETAPPCTANPLYIADEHDVEDTDRRIMKATCRGCPLVDLCAAYAARARPPAGMWAGNYYARKSRGRTRRNPLGEAVAE